MNALLKVASLAVGFSAMLAGAQPSYAADKVSLRLPWLLNVQSAGYVMAQEKGFYEQAGLDLEIMPGGPNLNSTALVASGANTFGINDVGQVLMGDAKGMDLLMVGACFQHHPAGVVSLEASGITKPADLEGKTIAYTEGGPWILTKAMLAKAGIALDKVNLVVSPSSELLKSGAVDAKTAFVINEGVALNLAGYKTAALMPSDYGVQAYAEVIFVARKTAEENPDLVRRFVAATQAGYDYAYANKDETVSTLVALNKQLDPEQQSAQLALQESYVYTDFSRAKGACAFDGAVIAETANILTEFGDLKGDLNISTLYSTDFIPVK